jgi:N-acetylneuraminate synthase
MLMHCQATYPAKEEDLNLLCVKALKDRYNCDIGYSGHEVSPIPSVISVALGALAIERHITLDRAMYGSDQSASLEARGLQIMVTNAKNIARLLGDGIKKITPEEQANAVKLRYFRNTANDIE